MASDDSSHGAAPQPPCPRRAPPPPEAVPLLVTVLGGNVVTAAEVAACLNTTDAAVLRRLHPAIAVAMAAVPWADTTPPVRDITRWRAALPAAVGLKCGSFGNADIARLPPTLRSLDVSHCRRLNQQVSFAHLRALEVLNCSGTAVVVAGVAHLPPSLRELRMQFCELPIAVDFTHLRALRVLQWTGTGAGTGSGTGIDAHCMLSVAAIASLPPSLEVVDIGWNVVDYGTISVWPPGGSLAHLTHLRVLRVERTSIDAASLATFAPSLHILDLKRCGRGGLATGAAASFAHLPCLHTLNASNSDIGSLASLPASLESLNLRNWQGAGATPAAVFPPLPALRVLDVSGTALGDPAVASIPPSLEDLHMVNCSNVTQRASLDHLTELRMLHSSGTDLSPATITLCRARGCAAPADGVVTRPNVERVHVPVLVVPMLDGRLVSCTYNGRVALWAAVHGAAALAEASIEHPWAEATDHVCALAALPDGHRVAIALRTSNPVRGGIFVWDTRAAPVTRAPIDFTHGSQPTLLAALLHGNMVVGLSDGALRIVDVYAGAALATLKEHTDEVAALAMLPDGRLASGSWDATVRLWDVDAQSCVATLAGHKGHVTSLAVLPDGRLASGSWDGTVRLWDVGSHACVGMLQGSPRALVVLPGANRLGGISNDDTLLVWDTRDAAGDGAPALTVELAGSEATTLVPLPGGRLATGGRGVRLWQLPLEAQEAL